MQIPRFKCDLCGKEYSNRGENNKAEPIGGMNGFYIKQIPDAEKILKPTLMQYNLDFCVECNKKMMDYYLLLKKE